MVNIVNDFDLVTCTSEEVFKLYKNVLKEGNEKRTKLFTSLIRVIKDTNDYFETKHFTLKIQEEKSDTSPIVGIDLSTLKQSSDKCFIVELFYQMKNKAPEVNLFFEGEFIGIEI